jgi:NADPH:quinone reductase
MWTPGICPLPSHEGIRVDIKDRDASIFRSLHQSPGKGVDIVIESIGGIVTSEALSSLSLGGILITLGYSAGRKTTIDVTDLIWKRAKMAGFSLFAQTPTAIAAAWRDVIQLMVSGSVKPIVERVYPFGEAGEALRHLIEDRPFGKVVLAG